MKVSFWHKCWEQSRIGFHQDQVHPFLSQYLFPLINKQDRHVFVPFSGKTLDMRWLAQHMKVSGSELSEIACRDFFSEGNIDSQILSLPLSKRTAHSIRCVLLVGLALGSTNSTSVAINYDREWR